ncbi:MAG: type IV toxin-antitoxin system AbiEi family antitoxin [Elusimicrobiota bacterium]
MGRPIFTLLEAQHILRASYGNTKKLLHDLVRLNWLRRLGRGRYLIVPLGVSDRNEYTADELLIASHLVSPYYISWWTALHHYGYTEQVSRKVYIAVQAQNRPLTLSGVTYQFITLKKSKFFGFEEVWVQDQKVKMASREKMVIDCLDRPDLCGGIVEAAKGLWNGRTELDLSLLVRYAVMMKAKTVCKRLGYLLEFFELGGKPDLLRLQNIMLPGWSILDPNLPKTERYMSRWRLQLNVRDEDLRSWKGT